MSPLRIIRRFHAPLACLAIACLVSAGCRGRETTVSLGQPEQAYRATDGSVLFGYNVLPTPQVTLQPSVQPEYAGWHWLVIEPSTAKLLMQAVPPDATDDRERIVSVTYEGWGRNARLIPPLLEPGRPDDTPPVVGDGGLTRLLFTWDSGQRGARLIDQDLATLPLIRVSPDAATLRTWEVNREVWLDILKVAAVAGIVVGLIALGGSGSISIN